MKSGALVMDFRITFWLFASHYCGICLSKNIVNIGAIFPNDNPEAELAFRNAINRLNLYEEKHKLRPIIKHVSEQDDFNAGQIACEMAQKGVAAIFSSNHNEIIQSVSKNLEIPQFQIFWNTKLAQFSEEYEHDKPNLLFNLYPEPHSLAQAYATLLREMNWKKYLVLYETEEGLIKLQELLKTHGPRDFPVTLRRLGEGPDYRPLLKEIKESSVSQIILDCETDHILDILLQAKEVKLMEEYHSYILTSLDVHTVDFSELKDTKSNVTSLRLIDPASKHIRMVARDWELAPLSRAERPERPRVPPESIRTMAALIYDALNLFITVYYELDITETMAAKPLNCEEYNTTSDHGLRIAAFIHIRPVNKGRMIGPLTGPLVFDAAGRRTKFNLQVIERSTEGFRVIGIWDSTKPQIINVTITETERREEIQKKIHKKKFIVASKSGAPYLVKLEDKNLKGNDRFEGYIKDLLDGISELLNSTYELYLVQDNSHGNYVPEKKEWNGLIKELLDRKADLAVCDLTITHERRKVVDFTMPFMTLGISILHSKTRKEPPALLSFMKPLSMDVWLYVATTYLGISIIMFLVARLAPGDWENPHPCNQQPEQLENIWDIKNCFWLTMGSILQQGCDILPKGISTRMITGMWWFFTLIMTASYTANMAAFLTMERMGPVIENAEDLARQSRIKYGLYGGGATKVFFKDSNFSLYQRMWTQMENTNPSVFESSNDEGVKRVRQSKGMYAFLMESSTLEYVKSKYCDLKKVGPWLDVKGYGIAMPVNSEYRDEISGAVLKMQELGKLHEIKETWWNNKCEKDKSLDEGAARLGLPNVGGAFVVLTAGVFLAFCVALIEFLWNVKKIAVKEHLPLWNVFLMELNFAISVRIRKKRIRRSITQTDEIEFSEKL